MSESTPGRQHRRPDVTGIELIGGVESRRLFLADHDPGWVDRYREHETRIRAAVGPAALTIEHIGSTSVPGLAAKPIIDVLVVVDDITAEEDYLPALIAAGYELRVREPGHRMVRTPAIDTHVHVLELGDPAAEAYLLFRDQLRRDHGDRQAYEDVKRRLVAQDWADTNDYADAKTEIVEAIRAKAIRARAVEATATAHRQCTTSPVSDESP